MAIIPFDIHFMYFQPKIDPKLQTSPNSVVLITGCDSGIGRASAEKLLKEGYHVIATVFTETVSANR